MFERPASVIAWPMTSRIASDGSTAITRSTMPASGTAKRPPPAPMSIHVSPGCASASTIGHSIDSRRLGLKEAATGA